jgi:hypothetical protein
MYKKASSRGALARCRAINRFRGRLFRENSLARLRKRQRKMGAKSFSRGTGEGGPRVSEGRMRASSPRGISPNRLPGFDRARYRRLQSRCRCEPAKCGIGAREASVARCVMLLLFLAVMGGPSSPTIKGSWARWLLRKGPSSGPALPGPLLPHGGRRGVCRQRWRQYLATTGAGNQLM